jgi:hypothetical protein
MRGIDRAGERVINRFKTGLFGVLFCAGVFAATNTGPAKYVRVGSLPAGWQIPLIRHGDRLQKPGKERLVLTGTITRNGAATSQFQLVHELPNSINYQEQTGGKTQKLVFNGSQFSNSGGNVQEQDSDLIETLVYDSPLWFLYTPSSGLAVRKLGSRFRSDGQTGKVYSGPVYDVYLVLVAVQQPGKVKSQPKFYHVNSDTGLIERFNYQDSDHPGTKVEVILSNWISVSNNQVPQLIRRLENGTEVLRFAVASATFGPSVPDATFQIQ